MRKLIVAFMISLFANQAAAEKLQVTAGTTSLCVDLYVQHSTTGAGLSGIAWNASPAPTCFYDRNSASSATAITLAAGSALGTWADGMWREVDSTNMPGVYQLCLPNAALAAGAHNVVGVCRGATNMAAVPFEIALVSFPTQPDGQIVSASSATRFRLASGQNSGRLDQQVCFITGSNAGQCRRISAQDGTDTDVASAYTNMPSAGDWYSLGGTTSSGGGGSSPAQGQTTP